METRKVMCKCGQVAEIKCEDWRGFGQKIVKCPACSSLMTFRPVDMFPGKLNRPAMLVNLNG